MTARSAEPIAPPGTRPGVRRLVSGAVSLVVVVAVFWYFLPQFTSISDVWASISTMSPGRVVLLVLVAGWNLVTYGPVIAATTPGLTLGQAVVVTESTTAVNNTVPGGGAMGIAMTFGMYTSWGFSRSRTTVSLLLSGIWNNLLKLGMPVVALALVALQGHPSQGRLLLGLAGLVALAAALVLFALMLRSEQQARRVGQGAQRVASVVLRPFGRPPARGWDLATTKFRDRTVLLLKARWHWLSLTTLVSHLSLFAVLLLSLRSTGVGPGQVSWAEVLAVFAFARLASAIPLTPGGLGIVEAALITGLSAAGGPAAGVTAGVLVFRALTYVLPIPVGLVTYLFWRRNTSWRRPPNSAPRTVLVPETA